MGFNGFAYVDVMVFNWDLMVFLWCFNCGLNGSKLVGSELVQLNLLSKVKCTHQPRIAILPSGMILRNEWNVLWDSMGLSGCMIYPLVSSS